MNNYLSGLSKGFLDVFRSDSNLKFQIPIPLLHHLQSERSLNPESCLSNMLRFTEN